MPTRRGHIKIKPRQDQRALWQLCHRLHQGQCRAARSRRSRQNYRGSWWRYSPYCRQPFDHTPLSGLGVKRLIRRSKKRLDDLQKLQRPAPMARLIANVQFGNHVRRHAFALHFIHQTCQTVGQIVQRRARRKIGFAVEQASHKLR